MRRLPRSRLFLGLFLSFGIGGAAARAQGSPPATAAEQQSIDHYKKGVTAYDLGKFDEAVEEFQKAYEIKPQPPYLYNIAQAYRQKGDAAKAVFFYRRYLQKAPDASNRATVEKRIGELEELAKKQEESKVTPPNSLEGEKSDKPEPPRPEPPKPEPPRPEPVKVEPPRPVKVAAAEKPSRPEPPPPDPAAEQTVTASASPSRSVARLSLEAGPAFVGLGSGPDVPAQISIRVGAAYTLHLGALELDLGLAATLTPIPFETLDRSSSGTAMMIGGLGNVTGRFPIAGALALRGELGGGIIAFSGLADGNPFTDAGKKSGAVTMPHLRAAVGADYELGGGLTITVTTAFSYTVPGDALDARIDSITRFDILAGLAYAL